MKVIIYVEGPSDKSAMENSFRSLIEKKEEEGVSIGFLEAPRGDKKKKLLDEIPKKAVNILRNDPYTMVMVIPDLYPKNKSFPHTKLQEMQQGIIECFKKAMHDKNIKDDRLLERFHVFCFKYDLEVLLLASIEALSQHLDVDVDKVQQIWVVPVENQNHDRPPRRVVEEIFSTHHRNYRDTVDAPLILANCDYHVLAERCPECFKPIVEFLTALEA